MATDSGQRCLSLSDRFKWLRDVILHVRSTRAHMVAAMLADHCNSSDGQCNPGRKRLSELTGLHETNVSRSLKKLQDAGFIRQGISETRAKQWDLIQPILTVSKSTPQRYQKRHSKGVTGDTQNSVVESSNRTKKKPSPDSGSQNPQKQANGAWRPTPNREKDFFKITGMTTEELEYEIDRFIAYNEREHTLPHLWQEHWLKWCHQINRHKVETSKQKINGETNMPLTDGLGRVLKRKAEEKPCWERWGTRGFDPFAFPKQFIEKGCSLFGGCECTKEQRERIIDGKKDVNKP
ncbi:MAG: helix-turn-helix domain-containing protein [Geminicoccaceae bacterium]